MGRRGGDGEPPTPADGGAAQGSPVADSHADSLRKITLAGGVALIVGSIVGSGIFVSPTGVFLKTQSAGFSLVIWMLSGKGLTMYPWVTARVATQGGEPLALPAGVFSCLGALCYAELGTVVNRSGGEYAYLTAALGPLPGFLQLWTSLVVLQPTPLAVMARTFAIYTAKPFFTGCDPPEAVVKLLAIVGLGEAAGPAGLLACWVPAPGHVRLLPPPCIYS